MGFLKKKFIKKLNLKKYHLKEIKESSWKN